MIEYYREKSKQVANTEKLTKLNSVNTTGVDFEKFTIKIII